MAFKRVAFDALETSFGNQIKILMGKHNAIVPEELDWPRKQQVLFLLEALIQVKNSEASVKLGDRQKSLIFNGLLLTMARQIDNEYKISSPRKSIFRKSIDLIMNISEMNELDCVAAVEMLSAAMNFLTSMIYEDGNVKKSLIGEHPLMSIPQFSTVKFCELGSDLMSEYRKKYLQASEKELQKEKIGKEGNQGSWHIFSKKAGKKPKILENESADSDDNSEDERFDARVV